MNMMSKPAKIVTEANRKNIELRRRPRDDAKSNVDEQ